MTNIDFEAKHPRQDSGKFAAKEGEAANVSLSAPAEPEVHRSYDGKELAVTLADGTELDVYLDHASASHIDPKVIEREDGNIEVRWASLDDDAMDYEFTEGDNLTRFDSADARDEHVESLLAEGVKPEQIFVVERFEHGNSKYSVLGDWNEWSEDQRPERARVSDRWDSAPSTVIVVDKGDVGGVTDYRAAADALAEDYTSWANGDVYGVHRAVVDREGDEVEEQESSWGLIGTEWAEQSVEDGDF